VDDLPMMTDAESTGLWQSSPNPDPRQPVPVAEPTHPVPYDDPHQPVPDADSPQPAPATMAESTYFGNQQDLTAFLAMVAGVGMVALSCVPGASCVGLIFALVAGTIGLRDADRAVNPGRARLHAGLALASGALIVLGMLLAASLSAALIGALIALANNLSQ